MSDENSGVVRTHGQFPRVRMRRNRRHAWSRRLVRETTVTADDLIWPLFVQEGTGREDAVASMPGVSRLSPDKIVEAAQEARDLGIPVIALFPYLDQSLKTPDGRESLKAGNLICRSIAAVKKAVPDIGIMCDVALDPFTDHGHDGVIIDDYVHNDETLKILRQQALVQAEAGADIISPSDMMDGRIGIIRDVLDSSALDHVAIMAYSAKFASGFYGPFRDALGSAANLGQADKKTYQMDPANGDEALREIGLDLAEGADMVMVKPGMPYLDLVRRCKDNFRVPTYAYQVSGEYAMLMGAVERGWLDGARVIPEAIQCFKRAGADGVLSYFARDVARMLAATP